MKDCHDRRNRQTTSHNHYQQFRKTEENDESQETIEGIFAKVLFVIGKI
jgi:hypothetical protein